MAATIIDHLATRISFLVDGKDLDAARNGLKKLDRQYTDTVKSLSKGAAILGAALTGVGATVVKATVPYEQDRNDIQAFADLTEQELGTLDEIAREVGSSGRFGATDVLQGQKEFLRNQFSVNETLAATPHIERLATAGLMELDAAADLVAHTLRRFDLGADSVEHVTDVLAAMTKTSGMNLNELEATFRRAALVADRLGLSFEDTAAGVALLAREGLRPREAGSLLEAMLEDLTDLTKLSDTAQQELARVDLDGGFLQRLASSGQVTRVFDELRRSGADIAKVFSTEGIDAAQILFDAGDQYAAMAKRFVSGVAGTSRIMADTRDLGLPGAIEDLKSAVNAFQLSLGSSGLTGILEGIFDKFSAFVLWLRDASDWVKTLGVAVIAAGPVLLGLAAATKVASFALGGLKVVVGLLRFGLGALRLAVNMLTISWWRQNISLAVTWVRLQMLTVKAWAASVAETALAAKTALWTAATTVATAATWAFGVALRALPFVFIISALAGLAFAIYKFRDQILGAFKTAWNWIKANWPLLVGILLGPFGIVGALVWKFKDQIVEGLQALWDWIKDAPIFAPIIDGIQWVIDQLQTLFGWIGKVKDGFGKVGDAFGAVGGFFGKVGDFLGFQEGGIVPGPTGRPRLAMVHGGEMVLPQTAVDMFKGFLAGPQALPTAPPGAAQIYRQSISSRPTVNITGDIVVNAAPGADSEEIARNIADAIDEAIGERFRDVAKDFDSGIDR